MFIILDRDGVINEESREYIKSPDEWHPLPGSLEAIAKLKKAGCQVVVATNQSGIARGLYTEETLIQIHQKMIDALKACGAVLDGIYYCPHHPDQKCGCRKPEPGMLYDIARDFSFDLSETFFIGDSIRDIKAAQSVGVKPILVLTGNGNQTLSKINQDKIPVYKDLAEAVENLIQPSF